MKGDLVQSGKHHQDALRIAIRMQTLYGQSISVGNLGLVSFKRKDYNTAITCFQQHIQLVQALQDVDAEVMAWITVSDGHLLLHSLIKTITTIQSCASMTQLAMINQAQENYHEALTNFDNGRKLAEKEGLLNELRRIHCLIGLNKGEKDFTSHLKSVSESVC